MSEHAPTPDRPWISLIVACSENGVIGRDGDLPWRLPDDLKHFMRETRGHPVVMGRKTYDSLPKPLADRTTIVVSRSLKEPSGLDVSFRVARSVDEAIAIGAGICEADSVNRLWIAGGETIYRSTLDRADEVVRTLVHTRIDGDTRFPDLDPGDWALESSDHHPADPRHDHAFTIDRWRRSD